MPIAPASRRVRRLLVLVVVSGLVSAACGNSSDDGAGRNEADEQDVATNESPGVTDDEIQFSAFGTISNNPLGTCILECYVQGVEAYFAYRNSQGGIYDRKLVVSKKLDDELGNNEQRALEITSANDTFAAFSAAELSSGWDEIAKAGMPLYMWNIDPAASSGYEEMFGTWGVLCSSCTRRLDPYVIQMTGAKTVGVLGYGVSEISKKAAQAIRSSVERYSDDIGGVKVGFFDDNLEFGLANGIGPQVTAMKKAGVDLVLPTIDLNGMKTLAQEMERQGMGDVPLVHKNTYDAAFVKKAGDLFEGDVMVVTFRPFEAEDEGTALETFKKWMKKQGHEITELAMYGWINATTAYDGLKAAGENFNRAKVIAATNKIEDFTAGGLIPPLDFGRQHVPPTEDDPKTHGDDPECLTFVKVHDGEFEMVGDTDKPWRCWPGDTRAWSEPEPMNFT